MLSHATRRATGLFVLFALIFLGSGLGSPDVAAEDDQGSRSASVWTSLDSWPPNGRTDNRFSGALRLRPRAANRDRVMANVDREVAELSQVDIGRLSSRDPWNRAYRERISADVGRRVESGLRESLADYLLETTTLDRRVRRVRDKLDSVGARRRGALQMKVGVSGALPVVEMEYSRGPRSLFLTVGGKGLAELDFKPSETGPLRIKGRFDARASRYDLTCRLTF